MRSKQTASTIAGERLLALTTSLPRCRMLTWHGQLAHTISWHNRTETVCTWSEQHPHSAALARTDTARRDSGPAPPPASGDAVAAFRLRDPDLTPTPRAPRVRSGSLQLHSAQCEGGDTYLLLLGEPGTAPGPGKSRPRFQVPPDPFLPPPNAVVPAVHMAVECASKTSAHDRGWCTGRRAPRGRRTYRPAPGDRGTCRREGSCRTGAARPGPVIVEGTKRTVRGVHLQANLRMPHGCGCLHPGNEISDHAAWNTCRGGALSLG